MFHVHKIRWTLHTIFGVAVVVAVPVVLFGILTAIIWSMVISAVDVMHVGSIIAVSFVLLWFGHWLWKQIAKDPSVSGAVTRGEMWYDYRSVLVRIDLTPFVYRREIDDIVVLGTHDGKCTIVLPESAFETAEDYRASRELLEVNSSK